jgi:hypothetical protein
MTAVEIAKKKPLISRGEKKIKKEFLGIVSHTIRNPQPSSTRTKQTITLAPNVVEILCNE